MNYLIAEIHPERWTSVEVIAVIGACATVLLPAMGVFIVTVIGKLREQVSQVAAKADVIVGHVNSEKTAAEGRESQLRHEVVMLREHLAEQSKAAALLAQAVAQRPATSDPLLPIEVIVANPSSNPAQVEQIAGNK